MDTLDTIIKLSKLGIVIDVQAMTSCNNSTWISGIRVKSDKKTLWIQKSFADSRTAYNEALNLACEVMENWNKD